VPLFHHRAPLFVSDFYARRFAFPAILRIPLTENNIPLCFPGAFRQFVGTKEEPATLFSSFRASIAMNAVKKRQHETKHAQSRSDRRIEGSLFAAYIKIADRFG